VNRLGAVTASEPCGDRAAYRFDHIAPVTNRTHVCSLSSVTSRDMSCGSAQKSYERFTPRSY